MPGLPPPNTLEITTMKKPWTTRARLIGVFIALGGLVMLAAGFAPPAPQTIFVDLAVGQPVTLDQIAGRWQIGALQMDPPVRLGYTVKAIGADCIVLDDISGLKQLRIPSTAVSAVVTTRLQPKAQPESR